MRELIQKINKTAILLLLGVGMLSHSCIKEKLENCASYEFTLDFIYDYNVDDTDKFTDLVETVDLYIYTKAGTLVSKEVITKAELVANNYKHKVDLMVGQYDVVVWMNLTNDYTVTNENKFSTARLTAASPNNEIENGMGDIYYGHLDLVVADKQQIRENTISLIKDTNLIDVDAIFNVKLPDTHKIEIEITGTNATYDFSNKSVTTVPEIRYIPTYSVAWTPQTNSAKFSTVQKISSEDDLVLTITQKETGQADVVLKSVMMTQEIMKNPIYDTDAKLDKHDMFHLEFYFTYDPGDGTFMVASIVVDDWVVYDSEIGIM